MFTSINQTVARAVIGTAGTLFCAGLCLVGATALAHAATTAVARTATVRYADLDLGRPAGRAALDRRLRSAARSVCTVDGTASVPSIIDTRCVRAALRNAQAKVATVDGAVTG